MDPQASISASCWVRMARSRIPGIDNWLLSPQPVQRDKVLATQRNWRQTVDTHILRTTRIDSTFGTPNEDRRAEALLVYHSQGQPLPIACHRVRRNPPIDMDNTKETVSDGPQERSHWRQSAVPRQEPFTRGSTVWLRSGSARSLPLVVSRVRADNTGTRTYQLADSSGIPYGNGHWFRREELSTR
ncbi:hypothetical protein BDV97DRAFT_160052 [Delphinella strobiligena]|nr:hypothetical protein BDV97DRAFT_160052 [Delphinella strobiligena]